MTYTIPIGCKAWFSSFSPTSSYHGWLAKFDIPTTVWSSDIELLIDATEARIEDDLDSRYPR